MRLSRSVVVPLLLCTHVVAAHAQVAGALDVAGGLGQSAPGAWLRESVIAPMLRIDNRHGFLHIDAEAIERAGELSLRRHRAAWIGSSPVFGAFRVAVGGDYSHDLRAVPPFRESFSVTSAISAKWGASGARTAVTRSQGSGVRVDVGGWRVIGGAIVSLASGTHFVDAAAPRSRVVTFVDSVFNDTTGNWSFFPGERTVTDSGARHLQRWSDVEGRVEWAIGRLMLSASMSGRPAVDSTAAMLWGRLSATMEVRAGVFLMAGGGTLPLPGPTTARSSRYATVGIRLSPAAIFRSPLPPGVRTTASAFSVKPAAPGTYLVTLRVPSARVVEISGDFTSWSSVALRESSPNVWQVTLPIEPGTHRINVRVDGDAWRAPPGLPAVDDEFNGRVGLLVIR